MSGKAFLALKLLWNSLFTSCNSKTFDIYYVGYAGDYVHLLVEHNFSVGLTYTSKHRPWILKAVFSCAGTEADAMSIEKFIKKQKSRKLIERMVNGEELT